MAQLCASSPMQQVAVDTFQKVQVLVLGGAVYGGKSYLAAMLSALYADDPDARIAVFRRTLGEMKQGGGIVDTFKSVYGNLGDSCRMEVTSNPLQGKIVTGPGAGARRGEGCRIEFKQMDSAKDQEKVRGGAYSLALIEEATPYFSQEEIEMIGSRLRAFSNSKYESKMLITCNPVKDHFICDLIKDYYLDEEGYAIRERCGHVRYYMKHGADYYWGDSKEEVLEQVEPLGAFSYNEDLSYEDKLLRVTSFSFVQLTAKDNPLGMKASPGYMAKLEALDPVRKARDLFGNWFVEEAGGSVFQRTMVRGDQGQRVKGIRDIPSGCVALRGVDKAYSECSDRNPDPDYTALSPLLLKDRDGMYWLLGNYHNDVTDKVPYKKSDKTVVGRFRKLPGERDNLISLQLQTDDANKASYGYSSPKLGLGKDSGGGSGDYYSTLTRMAEDGVQVVKDKTVSNVTGKKMTDFLAFTAAAEQGLVYIVEETFDPRMLETWYSELEGFDGENSTRLKKDDHVDAIALAFNCMRDLKRPYRTIIRNQRRVDTLSSELYK